MSYLKPKNITIGTFVAQPSGGHTGDTTETVADTIEIPAGTFIVGDVLNIFGILNQDGAVASEIKFYLNTSANLSGSPVQIARYTTGARTLSLKREMFVRSSTTVQSSYTGVNNNANQAGSTSNTPTLITVPSFTGTLYLVVTITLGSAAYTGYIDAYLERKRTN